MESALLSRGFHYGTAPNSVVIGWNSGHAAVTLPDGTPVSSGESGAGVRVGGGGAFQPQFSRRMYLPVQAAQMNTQSAPVAPAEPVPPGEPVPVPAPSPAEPAPAPSPAEPAPPAEPAAVPVDSVPAAASEDPAQVIELPAVEVVAPVPAPPVDAAPVVVENVVVEHVPVPGGPA